MPGMSLKRVMTVVRVSDGRLVVHNAMALDEDSMRRLEAWGKPSVMLVPSAIHRLDARAYKQRYPDMTVYAPAGARQAVSDVVALDGAFEDFAPLPELRLETLSGVASAEGAMVVKSSDGTTVVLNDALFNMDKKKDLLGYLFTTLMGSAPGPRVSRLARLLLVKDRKALRRDFERFAALADLVRLIVAHEKVASGPGARQALLQAAEYL